MKKVAILSTIVVLAATHARALPIAPGLDVSVYANVTDPVELTFSPDGVVYAGRNDAQSGGSATGAVRIHRIGQGGSPVEEYGAVATPDPDAVQYDATGVISGTPGSVIVGGVGGQISAILPDESVVTLISNNQNLGNPSRMTVDTAGRLLFTDITASSIFRYDGTLEKLVTLPNDPYSIVVNSQDEIYSITADGTLMKFASDGTILNPSVVTGLGTSSALGIGNGGIWGEDLYAYSNGDLLRINSDGHTSVIANGFTTYPRDIHIGPDGAMYLAMVQEDIIIRIAPEPSSLMLITVLVSFRLTRRT